MKPSRRKAGCLSWQKIESIACIYMAVKDQGATSDEAHENAQSSELSEKLLTHHQLLQHMKYARNPNKLKMDPMNSWHMACPTLAYPLLTQQSTRNVFIGLIIQPRGDSCATRAVPVNPWTV
ncbi:hypothetical protein Tsp_15273 [Trichinella spiralis]|uniref:hypothetical protein n=1 Tax=Trichinella spiralis TaxID=6334 RepID=UPI0001EFE48A|nr:hypothetical protein Tsp_15273 [Trichinella spiralis]